MEALIVGADRLGNIPDVLKANGIDHYTHISGRKKGMRNLSVPSNVEIVIFLTDFIEHPTLKNMKAQVKELNIPCIYSKRSVTDLQLKLDQCKDCKFNTINNCKFGSCKN
jgi:hypothetical protein